MASKIDPQQQLDLFNRLKKIALNMIVSLDPKYRTLYIFNRKIQTVLVYDDSWEFLYHLGFEPDGIDKLVVKQLNTAVNAACVFCLEDKIEALSQSTPIIQEWKNVYDALRPLPLFTVHPSNTNDMQSENESQDALVDDKASKDDDEYIPSDQKGHIATTDRYDRGIKIVTGFLRHLMQRYYFPAIIEICCAFCDYKYQIEPNNRTGEEILRNDQVHKIYFRINKDFKPNDLHLYVGIVPTDGDSRVDQGYSGTNRYNQYGFINTGWGLFYFGTGKEKGYGGICKANIKPNDLISMVVDLKRGYLTFKVEGMEYPSEDIDLLKKYKIAAWPADQVEIVCLPL